jgi:hypothetical protein
VGEGEDSGQYALDGDLAAALLRTGRNFDSIDKRADSFYYLRARCLMLQRLVESGDLFAIEAGRFG